MIKFIPRLLHAKTEQVWWSLGMYDHLILANDIIVGALGYTRLFCDDYKRIRIAFLMLHISFRHPSIAAKAAATLN